MLGAPGDTVLSSSAPQQSDWGGRWEERGLHPQTATEFRWQLWLLDDRVRGERGAWSPVEGRLWEAGQVTRSGREQERRCRRRGGQCGREPRQARQQHGWGVGRACPLPGPTGKLSCQETRRRGSELGVIAAQGRPQIRCRLGTLSTQAFLPHCVQTHARAASSGPLRAHGKHLTWSLCNPVLARRLTVSSTNCPGV